MNDLYDIIKVPDPVLKQKAHPVDGFDGDTARQIDTMINTMHYANGIGLAAPQVGILNRIFVMNVPDNAWAYEGEDDGVKKIVSVYRSGKGTLPEKRNQNTIAMINPEIISVSEEQSVFQEGCLSIPGQYADIVRPAVVTVRYWDAHKKEHEQSFKGLDSHCVQHELDHLNGVLFIDYLSTLKRNIMIKRVKKISKNAQ